MIIMIPIFGSNSRNSAKSCKSFKSESEPNLLKMWARRTFYKVPTMSCNKQCGKFGNYGHFAVCSNTKDRGDRYKDKKYGKRKKEFARQMNENSYDDYTFSVSYRDKTKKIEVMIGGTDEYDHL